MNQSDQVAAELAVTTPSPHPLMKTDVTPAAVYLASLLSGSRPVVRSSLRCYQRDLSPVVVVTVVVVTVVVLTVVVLTVGMAEPSPSRRTDRFRTLSSRRNWHRARSFQRRQSCRAR